MEQLYRKRYKENAKFIKNYNKIDLYELAVAYLHKRILKCNNVTYSADKTFIINHQKRIGLYVKSLRTNGSLKKKTKKNVETGMKRTNAAMWNNQHLVTTSASAFRRVKEFFKGDAKNDYKLIIIGGTDDHEQALFIREKSKGNSKVLNSYEVKLYEPNFKDDKVTMPFAGLIKKLNITRENKHSLMYDRSNHRITNTSDQCAVLVSLEVYRSMVDDSNRDPFYRKNLPFYTPRK